MAIEAVRIAFKYMTPVFILSSGYIANGAEPWKLPNISDLPEIKVTHPGPGDHFEPYLRDGKTLARKWALPGTAGLEHRIGGLEKADVTGNVSYDPQNHEKMVHIRAAKIARIAEDIPGAKVIGPEKAKLLVVSWGDTYGSVLAAVEEIHQEKKSVAFCHLRYLNPFPRNLEHLFHQYERLLIPELNLGHLLMLLRDRYPFIRATGFHQVQGQPFKVVDLKNKIKEML